MLCIRSIVPPIPNAVVIGDSRSNDFAAVSWPTQCAPLSNASRFRWTNTAISGETATTMLANYQAVVGSRFNFTTTQTLWFAAINAGTNDIFQGHSFDDIVASLNGLWSSVRSQGGKVISTTIFTTNGYTSDQITLMLLVNAYIKSNPQLWDACFDASAAFPNLTAPPFVDGLHLDDVGNGIYAADINAIIPTLGI